MQRLKRLSDDNVDRNVGLQILRSQEHTGTE